MKKRRKDEISTTRGTKTAFRWHKHGDEEKKEENINNANMK